MISLLCVISLFLSLIGVNVFQTSNRSWLISCFMKIRFFFIKCNSMSQLFYSFLIFQKSLNISFFLIIYFLNIYVIFTFTNYNCLNANYVTYINLWWVSSNLSKTLRYQCLIEQMLYLSLFSYVSYISSRFLCING